MTHLEANAISPLYDPLAMREAIQTYLGGASGAAFQIRECRIANTRRRDGSRGTVEYELTIDHLPSGRTWVQRVTGVSFGGDRTRRAWESIRQSTEATSAKASGTSLPAFAYVPELDVLLQVFPNDFRLPALAALVDGVPADLVPVLNAEFGAEHWELTKWSAEPVQYRVDMRAIIQISVQARNDIGALAERHYFGKVYRDGADCHRAAAAQRAVAMQAEDRRGALHAARMVAHLGSMHTLVTEALSGTSLSKIVRRGDAVALAVRAAARAVAEFHQLDVAATPRPASAEIGRLLEAGALLKSERPDLTAQIDRIVDAVIAGLADAPIGLIHGDLKPDHILIDGDRVSLIDFDLIARADPVADVAHLVAFLGKPLERALHRREDQTDIASVFLDEYFALAPQAWRSRLRIYHAMTAIHKAVGLSRRRGAEGQNRLEDVVREAEMLLAGRGDAAVPTFKRRMTRNAVRVP